MNRQQLEHLIRACGGIADDTHLIIVGSQAILGPYPDAPVELLVSMEADVYPKHSPDNSIVIDGAIGELSMFHQTFGYYAHGVSPDTVVLPWGWEERTVPVSNENTNGCTGECLETHDLAVSKLAAGREKDMDFLRVLLARRMVNVDTISERIGQTGSGGDQARDLMQTRLRAALPPRGRHR